MACRGMSRKEVDEMTPAQVHKAIGSVMLADGFDWVVDFDKSHGNWLVDSLTGKKYLDFFSYFASYALGHNHPKLNGDKKFVEKITRAALQNPSNSDVYSVEMAQFVATFERVAMPAEMKHVFFVTGGALAVENALKCAFDWKVRKNMAKGLGERGTQALHFKNSFHGRSGYTLSLTNTDPIKVNYFPKFADWPRVEPPLCLFPLEGENLKKVEASEAKALAVVRTILERQAVDVACILIETIQGEGGDQQWRKEFLQGLRKLADEFDVFLIFDEVQCGMGVTGKMWAWQHYGVVPDAMSFGKKAQVCGFMCGARVDEVKDNVFVVPSRINSTWGGNLTDMVRATRILEVIEEDHLIENAAKVGEYLRAGLVKLQAQFPALVSNARGLGLFCALDLPTTALRNAVKNACLDKGMLVLPSGTRTIRFRPSLTTSTEEVDQAMVILGQCLADTKL